MKSKIYVFLVFVGVMACSEVTPEKISHQHQSKTDLPKRVFVREIKKLIDSTRLKGAVLIYAPATNSYYSNDYEWCEKGHLPAST